MCCKIFWKRVTPFALTVWLGLSVANMFQRESFTENNQERVSEKVVYSKQGTGIGGMKGSDKGLPPFYVQNPPKELDYRKKTFQVLSKPSPNYTDAARQNQIQGKVRLRVSFLASGEIGYVSPIISLPDGLTEQATIAARQIKFKPEIRNGKPISVIKIVEYNFTIY